MYLVLIKVVFYLCVKVMYFLFVFSGDKKALHVLLIQNTKAQML